MARLLKCLVLIPVLAQAAPFQDPTRPPAEFLLSGTASAPVSEPLVLQSVLLAPQRQIAIINGQRVEVGQKIRGMELLSLSEKQAVLQGPQGRITLYLLPGASIRKRQMPGDPQ